MNTLRLEWGIPIGTAPEAPVSTDAPGDHVAVRSRRFASLSIKSLILLMLLFVSIGSNVVVGAIGYVNGTDSLRDAAYDRLIEVRDSRAREIVSLFDSIENSLLLASRDSAVADAEVAFDAGVRDLDDAGTAADTVDAAGAPAADPTSTDPASTPGVLTADQETELESYFTDDFGPAYADATGDTVDASSFLPTSPAAKYLLYHYTVAAAAGDQADDPAAVDDAGDGSTWSAAHAEFHDYLRRMATLLGFDDLALINAQGQVVYTVNKNVDLGADLVNGPYSFTSLAGAFDQAMASNVLDTVVFSDFAAYSPELSAPTSWVVTPIAGDESIVGALAVQLPVQRINDVMTGQGKWEDSGLGQTGEAYLVGSDAEHTMRSQSRDLVEDPKAYAKAAVAAGLSQSDADQAVKSGQSLLLQPVNGDAAKAAFDGKTGTVTTGNYLGRTTIAAYAPLSTHGLNWAIIAEIDSSEALAPVDDFTRTLAISSAILVAVVSLISVIIASLAVRPLRRLRDAARRIAAGEQGVLVEAGESDELADVAQAFNDMSRSLELKATLIDEQKAENERLLQTLMPEALAKRYKEGARTIVEEHQEVTVMFADIVGFEEYGRGMTSDKSLDILNDIFRSFDEAAEVLGVERVRSTRAGYLASCGLSVPRVDHSRRVVEFALEMQKIVERYGAQQGVHLALRAGLDTGTVTSGLVGRTHVVYDLWGDAVSLAFRLQGGAKEAGIFLTQRVVDKVADTLPFVDSGVVETSNGFQRVWRIDPASVERQR
ncbi:adenylate/guanylate cyclase domain-containing protein [soil metagenome]